MHGLIDLVKVMVGQATLSDLEETLKAKFGQERFLLVVQSGRGDIYRFGSEKMAGRKERRVNGRG